MKDEQRDQADWREELLQMASSLQDAKADQTDQEPKPKGLGKTKRPRGYYNSIKIRRKLSKASRLKNRKRKHHPAKRKSHK